MTEEKSNVKIRLSGGGSFTVQDVPRQRVDQWIYPGRVAVFNQGGRTIVVPFTSMDYMEITPA